MKPNLLLQTNFIQQNRRGSFFENMIDNRYQSCYTLDMFIANHIITRTSLPEKDASNPNSTHSSTMVVKLINISIPAILWSFDTISVSAFYVLQKTRLR